MNMVLYFHSVIQFHKLLAHTMLSLIHSLHEFYQ